MNEEHFAKQINPWLSIWTQPRKTMGAIVKKDPKRFIVWLAIMGGILFSFSWMGYLWMRYPSRGDLQHGFFILVVLFMGGVIGMINLYLGGWLYQLAGSWLGGKGTFIQLKCAVGWANYPFIVASILGLISLAVVPNPWLQAVVGLINFIVMIWAFVIFLNLIAAAHQFSIFKALFAFIIAFFLLFTVSVIVSLLVPLLSPLL